MIKRGLSGYQIRFIVLVLLALEVGGPAPLQAQTPILNLRSNANKVAQGEAQLLGDVVPGLVSGVGLCKRFATITQSGSVISTATSGRSSYESFCIPDEITGEIFQSLTDRMGLSDSLLALNTGAIIDTVASTGHPYLRFTTNAGAVGWRRSDFSEKTWFKADSLGQDSLTIFIPVWLDRTVVSAPNGGGQILTTQRHPRTGFHFEIIANQQVGVGDWGVPAVLFSPSAAPDEVMAGWNSAAAYKNAWMPQTGEFVLYEVAIDSTTYFEVRINGMIVDYFQTPGKMSNEDVYNDIALYVCSTGQGDDALRGGCGIPWVYNRSLADGEKEIVRDSLYNRYGIARPDTTGATTGPGDWQSTLIFPDLQWLVDGTFSTGGDAIDSMITNLPGMVSYFNVHTIAFVGDLVDETVTAEMDVVAPLVAASFAEVAATTVVCPGNHDYDTPGEPSRGTTDYKANLVAATDFTEHPLWHANQTRSGFINSDHAIGMFNTIELPNGDSLVVGCLQHEPDEDNLDEFQARIVAIGHDLDFVTHSIVNETCSSFEVADINYTTGTEQSGQVVADSLMDLARFAYNGHSARGPCVRQWPDIENATGYIFQLDRMLCFAGAGSDCAKMDDWLTNHHGLAYGGGGWVTVVMHSPSTDRVRVLTLSPYYAGGGGLRWRYLLTPYDYMNFDF